MSVREAVGTSGIAGSTGSAGSAENAEELSREVNRGWDRPTTPGTRRRPRQVSRQRPTTAPMAVRYHQSVAAGCSGPEVEVQGYRMSRWARLAVTASVVVAGLILLFTPVLDSPEPVLQQVTVSTGDTLWSIAQSAAPGQDVVDVVDQIIEVNQLTSYELPVGLVLRVPVAS